VGDQAKPKLRGPGTVGISALCGLARRFYVVLTRHDRSAFRPRVDFICGAGHLEGGDSRERAGLPAGGPRLVVSPLGVFDFEPTSKAMRVRSLQPGVTLEQVRDATAFDLVVEGTPPTTTMPSAAELSLLRTRVDTRRTLQRKVP
jgi:glutaconate CoA-transferase subunit B